MPTILVVEDETALRETLAYNLAVNSRPLHNHAGSETTKLRKT